MNKIGNYIAKTFRYIYIYFLNSVMYKRVGGFTTEYFYRMFYTFTAITPIV